MAILKSPKTLDFKGADKLESESLGDCFAAALGYSVEHSSEWKGLYVNDPFNTAKGVVAFVIDGIDKVHVDSIKSTTYELTGTGSQESLDSLLYRVHSAVDFDLTQGLEAVCRCFFFFFNIEPNFVFLVFSLTSTVQYLVTLN